MRAEPPKKLIARVGRRIAELRKEAELTHEELAELLNVSLQYAYRLEAPGENLTLTTLTRIATAFHLTVNELLDSPTSTTPKTTKTRKATIGRR